ncbi:ABC transporter, permease protein 2 (cluster 11, riboflavin/purine nucleoside) [[Mycoplasma] cavipharyngis]|uniref:ABC transporter permease n=1 Tax=[Mycoplasma] cavipharyngis TaxID=92757 RepID=UPI003704BEEA
MNIFTEIFSTSILFFCILVTAAIAALFSEKVGIVNIAVNGNMIFSAAFFGLAAQLFNTNSPLIQIVLYFIAICFGILFSILQNLLVIKLKADQIVAGIAMNLLGVGIAVILLQIAGTSNKFNFLIPELALGEDFQNLISLKLFLVLIVIVIAWFFLNKSRWGLRFKSIGENPNAAAVVGINVNSYKWFGTLISGALSGLAGAIFMNYVGTNFAANVKGLGFLGLAILIIGQWRIILIVIATLLFSFLYGSGITLSTGVGELKYLENYSSFFIIMPYLITIIVLAFSSKNSNAPKALGLVYQKEKR